MIARKNGALAEAAFTNTSGRDTGFSQAASSGALTSGPRRLKRAVRPS